MDEFDPKIAIRRYRRAAFLWSIPILIAYIALYALLDSVWFFCVVLPLFLVTMLLIRKRLSRKYIDGELFDNLDAERYRAVILNCDFFLRHGLRVISASYFAGDYRSVVSFCTQKLNDKKCKKHRFTYLCWLAKVYYEVGDLEKLRAVVDKFEFETESLADGDKIRRKLSVMGFFRNYLDGNYETCFEHYETRFNDQQLAQPDMRIALMQCHFNHAVINYRLGYYETAKTHFKTVVDIVPKLYLATSAARYLESIDNGTPYVSEFGELLPDLNAPMPRAKRSTIVKAVVVGVLAFVFLLLSLFSVKFTSKAERIQAVVSNHYPDSKVIAVTDLEYDGWDIATLVLCETKENTVVAGFVAVSNETNKAFFDTAIVNVKAGEEYTVKTVPKGYEVTFTVCNSSKDIPTNSILTVPTEMNGTLNGFLCVVDITWSYR